MDRCSLGSVEWVCCVRVFSIIMGNTHLALQWLFSSNGTLTVNDCYLKKKCMLSLKHQLGSMKVSFYLIFRATVAWGSACHGYRCYETTDNPFDLISSLAERWNISNFRVQEMLLKKSHLNINVHTSFTSLQCQMIMKTFHWIYRIPGSQRLHSLILKMYCNLHSFLEQFFRVGSTENMSRMVFTW